MQKLGLVLIILSFSPWLIVPFVVPFLPISITQKAFLIPVMLVVAELTFWLGLLLVGKEVAQRYRRYLRRRYLGMRLKRLWRPRRKRGLH
ncbi:transporter suffix domain-containing protein [Cylindrospermum sp. FACHB-282]|uniref:transporter suffix domain-containing protein n=1 Tax=Cylindrospermum sp. FACHB-282 TaxID=2692794 RepID=UPI001686353C|nr:transporter suffix domain-containing protein [Cylindrospermum sp. FACHB-282]MBD2384312.1 transporter suffix domain-containing protein [Cylindrospermum sp. FACHB-282]